MKQNFYYRTLSLALVVMFLIWCGGTAKAQSAADGFAPNINGLVYAVAVQADGKMVVGGNFTTVNGQPRSNLARINVDGTLDAGFTLGANGSVDALAIQSQSGQIVVGGSFSLLGGQARNNIGRMNLDGSLDASFLPGANGSVYTLAVQADNQIVMGGNFTVVAGQAHSHIARVNNNGLIDGSFNADASGYLNAIAFQSDGRILIGGVFTTVNNLTSNRIARLNTDGTLDTSFNPNANDIVSALAIQADGKVLVGGIFTAIGGQSRNRIARLNTDGSLDAGFFNLNANGDVDAILVKPDGTIVIGGNFSAPGNRLALINRDGSIGNPIAGADGFVAALATQPDGKVVAVGNFTTLGGSISRNHIGRFNLDNTVDRDFTVGANDFPAALAMQPDGKMLVGGLFTTLGGLPIPRLARLNLDGSFDVNFAPAPNGNVYVLAVQPDGKILAGGFFTTIGGQQRNFIARLNADGTVDGSFVAQCDGVVRDIVVQPDGKILIGGDFLTANGQLHNRVARLNANGTLDNNFNNFGASHSVYAIALQADGKIVIGGSFDFVNAQPRTAIARLNADGTLDAGFNPGAGFAVFALVIQTDGKILVGGDFSILGGQSRANFGRLNADGSLDTGFSPNVGSSGVSLVETIALQTDRKIIIGGSFETLGGQTRNNIGRVNANGTLDTGFNPGADSTVFSLLIQPDGKVMVGGSFTTLGGQPRQGLGRLTNTDAAPQLLSLTNANTGIYWGRTNAGPEVRRVSFETSTDGVNFSFVGAGTYSVLGAWTLTGLSLPTNQNFYVRARGFYGGGWRGNSGSIVESVRQSYIAAVVPCTFSLNPTSQNIGAAGGSSNTALTASAANCAWTVQSNAAWLTPSIFSGNGSASIGYVVAPNVGAQRTGTMTIAGQTLAVTQAAFACPVITVNPASLPVGIQGAAYNQSLTASGGTAPYTFSLTGSFPTGIGMTASGAIIGTPGVSGTFNLTIFVTDANGCTGSRSYTLTVNSVGGGNAGLQFYPLSRPVRILDTRAGQGNCDNISAPINGGTSLTTFARLTCEGISIPANAQAVVGNLTIINQTAQIGYLTIYPDGQAAPLAANMIYAPGDILANNFTVGLGANGNFNIFGERTIDAIVDISGYYAPPAAGGLYYHPLAKPIRLMDTRPGQGNCDNVGAPINAGGSLTTLARKTCEGLTIPAAAQAIVGNATVINVSGQVGYLTIYPNGVPAPLAANMVYFPGQLLSNAFTVSLSAGGEFNIFAERQIDMVIDVAGYYSNEANDANGAGLLFTPLATPVRLLDTRAGQGNCDSVNAPITGGGSLSKLARMTCEGQIIPNNAQAVIGNVTVINQTGLAGYLTLYPTGQAAPLAANMIYQPSQLLSNAFVVGLSGAGQFNIFAERTLEAIVDVSGFFAP